MIFFLSVGDTGQINAAVDLNQYMPAKPNCNLTFQPITVTLPVELLIVLNLTQAQGWIVFLIKC